MESPETITAKTSAPTPYSAMRRACVDENNETINTNKIGLTSHVGNEFAPPGLPSKVKNGID